MTHVRIVAAMMMRVGSLLMGEADQSPLPLMGWSAILIVFLVIMFLGVSWIRRWLRNDETATPMGFTLGDLRTLHRQGKMSDEEFDRAKALIIDAAKRAAERAVEREAANAEKPRLETDAELLARIARKRSR